MRRKFLTVLLALAATLCLCFGLAACGKKDKSPAADDDLWTAERLYAEAKALGFEGSFDDLVALFKGADGKDGRNGVGIASAKIDENGHLQITLTDGSVLDAGAVSGAPAQIEGTEGLAYHMRRSPTGEETLEVVGIGIAYDLDIVIPATYRGIPVTAIADRAFYDHSDLTSISIPDSVTSIGNYAFNGCTGLTSIKIPDGVTSIGRGAFNGCTGLTSIKIPDGVTKIEREAFNGCRNLASISIPDSVIEIGKDAFAGTSYMNTLSAHFDSDGVLYLGKILLKAQETVSGTYAINPGTKGIAGGAFENCGSLTGVTIPEGVKVIGEGAFSQSGLTGNITIPKSVCKVGYNAFQCDGLTAVNISDLRAWCQIDFTSWESNPLNYAHHLIVDGDEIADLVIPAGVTEIKPYVFCGADFTSVTIGNDVTSIGVGAFEDCNESKRDENTVALYLFYYLASWGMLRGSGWLMQKDYHIFIPIVQLLYNADKNLIDYDPAEGKMTLKEYVSTINSLGQEINKKFINLPYYKYNKISKKDEMFEVGDKTDRLTLISKILMGTLGCTPAVDNFDKKTLKWLSGWKTIGFKEKVLEFLWGLANMQSVRDAKERINSAYHVNYPIFKVLDMILWEYGKTIADTGEQDE